MSEARPRPGARPQDRAALSQLAAALDLLIAGGFVQGVRIAGPDLLGLSLRRPGATTLLGLSVLAMAPGVMLLDDLPSQPRADALVALRDLLRARLVGARLASVRAAAEPAFALRFDFGRRDGATIVVLDLAGRGNVEVHGEGLAPQALRPPTGESPPAPQAVADDATATATESAPLSEQDAQALGRDVSHALLGDVSHALLRDVSLDLANRRARLLHERALAELRQRLARATRAAAVLVERREADRARLGDPSDLRREADALAAHLHLLARGQSVLEVADWGGSPLRIALDPALGPPELLRRAYARAARAERGLTEAGARLGQARARHAALAELSQRAAGATLEWPGREEGEGLDAARTLAAIEADAARWLKPERAGGEDTGTPVSGSARAPGRAPSRAPGHRVAPSLAPKEYVSKDGLRILVGRNARGNHELTFRIARGNDVWLHARGCPGAHVVLVLPKGAEIPSESLVDAATLAHAHSGLGKEPRGEVTYCRAKDVHARRGMAPGQVTVTREKVLPLRLEPARLARLESTRAEHAP